MLTEVIEWGMSERIILDGALAESQTQRAVFWRLREEQPEGQRRLGPQLKHDLSIPPGHLVDFLNRANDICSEMLEGVVINTFGHLADGNVHYNLSPPAGEKDFFGLDNDLTFKLSALATEFGGSFAAEHGIGRKNKKTADVLRGQVERCLMVALKKAFDEDNNLNPEVLTSIAS